MWTASSASLRRKDWQYKMKKALVYGIAASFFFAFTFVLNRSMNLSGGYWMWSACLRYLFTLPLMWALVRRRGGTRPVLEDIRANKGQWFLWSTVGFGMFYLPLTMASQYGESWFVASSWQLTIVAGILLTPLFGKPVPMRNLIWSVVILVGVFLLQTEHLREGGSSWLALALILVAAFSYPLGNRKMMTVCPQRFSTIQRVFGMTLCSMPLWIGCSVYACAAHGLPSAGQLMQSFVVALFSGVAATVLFFEATNLVKSQPRRLAVIEATQSGEVVFTLLGGILVLGDPLPSVTGMIGIVVIVAGMIGSSLASA